MIENEWYFPATDGVHTLRACIWTSSDSDVSACGIVQLIHGMAEHIERYRDFANYLVDAGFIVCGHDHLGHGKSVLDDSELGHISFANGKDAMIDHVHRLRMHMQDTYGTDLPYFVMGHSMGSMIARAYLARYCQGLAGCVVCGTGNPSRALSEAGYALGHIVAACTDEACVDKLINNMGVGQFSRAIKDSRTDVDWISTDQAVVDAYIADLHCGQTFTIGGWTMISDLAREIVTNRHACCIEATCPLLFISGDQDPVGKNGVQVMRAVDLYKRAGVRDVNCILYPGMRHEILNEPGHMQVYKDVLTWITTHIPKDEQVC